jgi:cytochrome c peroxidase
MSSRLVMGVMLLAGCGGSSGDVAVGVEDEGLRAPIGALFESRDESGTVATYVDGDEVPSILRAPAEHAFFRSFGTNGRACIHCHVPAAGWTITPEVAQLRFTNPLDPRDPACLEDPFRCRFEPDPRKWGNDPLFRRVDGAVSPTADVSTPHARLVAYRMVLEKGLIRIGLPIPANAEFTLEAVDDPYHYASAAELSLFRRPLPSTNLRTGDGTNTLTLSGIMWDGREPNLGHQANSATLNHAEAHAPLDDVSQLQIIDFETHLHTAQVRDRRAGDLWRHGAQGGPRALAAQPFYAGINDVFAGDARTGAPFDPDVFNLYDGWKTEHKEARARIARGQQIFNRHPIAIRGVRGVNDAVGIETIIGSCTSCHDSPGYGHHSVPLPLDLGLTDAARRTPDLPLYTLRNRATGETMQTTDPGRALVTGRWRDIGKFKGPILRALAARAPYFHNGSAASLEEVVDFYDQRFGIGFSAEDKCDLVAFLRTL